MPLPNQDPLNHNIYLSDNIKGREEYQKKDSTSFLQINLDNQSPIINKIFFSFFNSIKMKKNNILEFSLYVQKYGKF